MVTKALFSGITKMRKINRFKMASEKYVQYNK